MLHKTNREQFREEDPLYPYPQRLGQFFFTTELLELARKNNATWLIDLIALHQRSPQIQSVRKVGTAQVWKLQVQPNRSAILTCSCHGQVILTRWLSQTSFPTSEIQLYLSNCILMLAAQYEEVA